MWPLEIAMWQDSQSQNDFDKTKFVLKIIWLELLKNMDTELFRNYPCTQHAHISVLHVIYNNLICLCPSGGSWVWLDGTPMPLPEGVDTWHSWYPGQPEDSTACTVTTNYKFWVSTIKLLSDYVWRSYECTINPNVIQGYICEREIYFVSL
jgi:hypothetical protein